MKLSPIVISFISLLFFLPTFAVVSEINDEMSDLSAIDTTKASFFAKKSDSTAKPSEALNYIDSAIFFNSNKPEYFFRRARLLGALNNLTEGLNAVEKAINLSPNPVPIYIYFKSRFLYDLKMNNDAFNVYKTAMALGEKDHFDLGKRIGERLHAQGIDNLDRKNFSKALEDLSRAEELRKDNYLIIFTQIAWINTNLKNFDAAIFNADKSISFIKKMKSINPKLTDINGHIADAYRVRSIARLQKDEFSQAKNDLYLAKGLVTNEETSFFWGDNSLSGINKAIAIMNNFSQTSKSTGSTQIASTNESFKTIKIGSLTWMAENYKTKRFANGNAIDYIQNADRYISTPAYAILKNGQYVYSWEAVKDSRGIAPKGWHVPTPSEWEQLIAYCKSSGDLKSTTGWPTINVGGYYQTIVCPNCVSWNNEYRRKVACNRCKDTRRIDGRKYIPNKYASLNGNNRLGFNLKNLGHLSDGRHSAVNYFWTSVLDTRPGSCGSECGNSYVFFIDGILSITNIKNSENMLPLRLVKDY